MGSKKFFSGGGPHPKPEVNLVEMAGGFVELGERYQVVKKIFEKFLRVTEIFGVKVKPLAPPSGKI